MDNIQERYGRLGKDKPSLISCVPILGRREINQPLKDMIPAHTLKYFQIIYVEKGEMEVWINGRIYTVHEKEIVVIQPYETMAYLKGVMPRGAHSFLQIDTNPIGENSVSSDLLKSLEAYLKMPAPKVLKAGSLFFDSFKGVLGEFRTSQEWSEEMALSHFKILCMNLIRIYEKVIKQQNIPENGSELLKALDDFIDANMDKEITVRQLADIAGYSENHFRVQFKKITDISPLKYVNMKKIDTARELLMNDKRSITDIAFELGFSSCQYFSTFFKKQTSFTPDEFRKEALLLMKKSVQKIVIAKEAAAQMDSFFRDEKK
ncbi:MAG: AraC family transcriptional regulator [Lentisphaeraceae bacterium]|nr:AraC family transcriptional regulator [Lentisphaeraceae bacterium]